LDIEYSYSNIAFKFELNTITSTRARLRVDLHMDALLCSNIYVL